MLAPAESCSKDVSQILEKSPVQLVRTGHFGEYMQIDSQNDGPVTMIVDSLESPTDARADAPDMGKRILSPDETKKKDARKKAEEERKRKDVEAAGGVKAATMKLERKQDEIEEEKAAEFEHLHKHKHAHDKAHFKGGGLEKVGEGKVKGQ